MSGWGLAADICLSASHHPPGPAPRPRPRPHRPSQRHGIYGASGRHVKHAQLAGCEQHLEGRGGVTRSRCPLAVIPLPPTHSHCHPPASQKWSCPHSLSFPCLRNSLPSLRHPPASHQWSLEVMPLPHTPISHRHPPASHQMSHAIIPSPHAVQCWSSPCLRRPGPSHPDALPTPPPGRP